MQRAPSLVRLLVVEMVAQFKVHILYGSKPRAVVSREQHNRCWFPDCIRETVMRRGGLDGLEDSH